MRIDFLQSPVFWRGFAAAFLLTAAVEIWQLNIFSPPLPFLPRPPATRDELVFAVMLALLLGLDTGLFVWRQKFGTCPTGVRRATGLGGALGIVALFCPVCLALPFSIIGLGVGLAALAPFVPLLRILALVLLGASTILLWPRR